MPENIAAIADGADMIVSGYAFTAAEMGIRVLNLGNPSSAMLITPGGDVLETTMDDLEIEIVRSLYMRNRHFMGASCA